MRYSEVKKGLAPGTVLYAGKRKVDSILIESVIFDKNTLSEETLTDVSKLEYKCDSDDIQWVTITGLHDSKMVEQIGSSFGIHNLVLEDILNTDHRPKVDFYSDYIYILFKSLSYNRSETAIEQEQISILLGRNFVLCFCEKDHTLFKSIRERLRVPGSKFRASGADYLAYTLMDVIIDHYFIVIEKISDKLDFYEEKIISGNHKGILNKIYLLKRQNLSITNSIWPLRELISQIERSDSGLIKKTNHIFFRDLYDHTIQIIDKINVYRELLTAIIDLHLSESGNRTNEVMKVLTIISTIFIPLTFIAGVYGMNFKFMPELQVHWAYFAVIGLMAALAILMLIYFRRKKWL